MYIVAMEIDIPARGSKPFPDVRYTFFGTSKEECEAKFRAHAKRDDHLRVAASGENWSFRWREVPISDG